jgi:hypothetical protein
LLSPKIWPARLTGISRMKIRAKASNAQVKCLLRPSHSGLHDTPCCHRPGAPVAERKRLRTPCWRRWDAATTSARLACGKPPGCWQACFPPATNRTSPRPSIQTSRSLPLAAPPLDAKPYQAPGIVQTSPTV